MNPVLHARCLIAGLLAEQRRGAAIEQHQTPIGIDHEDRVARLPHDLPEQRRVIPRQGDGLRAVGSFPGWHL